jgi:hypothetical protein
MPKTTRILIIIAVALCCVIVAAAVFYPPVHDRLAWRLYEAQVMVKSFINPPEKAAFISQTQSGSPMPTPQAQTTPLDPTPTPTWTPLAQVTMTPLPYPTATPTIEPLPSQVALKGVRYMDQHGLWNYCAPSNLAMALSYWGWKGDRLDTGKVLKPYDKDKNVMPYEMADYVTANTDLKALVRVAGDLDLVKRFLVKGFPVLVEKGAWIKDFSGVVSWMGHYEVITGYDDPKSELIAQDSYFTPDFPVPYDTFIEGWRSFNYTYVMIYPADRENEVMNILGAQADETANYQYAAQLASDEIYNLTGTDQFFAWYNRGTNLKELQDYTGSAIAYDQAFSIYNTLPEDRSVRPYRILWYETGPYFAYYYTGRYYDVINLSTTAIEAALDEPALEESFYWRAMAKNALGDTYGATQDFQESLKYHPDFQPTIYQLQLLGIQP